MEIRQLRYLDAVGELGSFSAAARRLHVVQPAISQQIRKLEEELGVDLVVRGRPAALTPAGELVARRARTILGEVDGILDDVGQPAGSVRGHINLGVMHWLGRIDLPAVLARYGERAPGVVVELMESTTPQMIAAVREGSLEVSFAMQPDATRPAGLSVLELESEDMLIAGSPVMMPTAPSLHLRFLQGRPFITFAEGTNLRATVDGALRRFDVHPDLKLESNEPLTVRNLAARGLGFALLPRSVVEAGGPPIAAATVHPTPVTRELSLVWKAGRRISPQAQRFISVVREHVAEIEAARRP
jgi:DNA-binding transcriptional LysR family regulator